MQFGRGVKIHLLARNWPKEPKPTMATRRGKAREPRDGRESEREGEGEGEEMLILSIGSMKSEDRGKEGGHVRKRADGGKGEEGRRGIGGGVVRGEVR